MTEPTESRVPEWISAPLRTLERLDAAALDSFKAVAGEPANLGRLSSLPRLLGEAAGVTTDAAVEVVSMLQWFAARADDAAFVDRFTQNLEVSGFSAEVAEMMKSLAANVCFRLGAKALEVYVRVPNSVVETKITSDIRPIWDTDGDHAKPPVAATIVHTLQVDYWSNEEAEEKGTFIEITPAKIHLLLTACKEALDKNASLEAMTDRAGLRVIRLGED